MSLSRAELAAMNRDEMIEVVGELSGTVENLQAALDVSIQRRKELQDQVENLEERLAAVESNVESIQGLGAERTSNETKIAQVVTYADNERDADQTRVTVLPKRIKGATGVSRRYAYQLADDMIDAYDWALDPRELSRSIEQSERQKGVTIDFERLHSESAAVNKFITGIQSNGGAE